MMRDSSPRSACAKRKHGEYLKHMGKGLKAHFVIPYHRHVETIAGLQHPIRIAKIQPMLLQIGLVFLLIPAYASDYQTYCSNIKSRGQWRRRTFYADRVSLATRRNAIVRLGSEGGTDCIQQRKANDIIRPVPAPQRAASADSSWPILLVPKLAGKARLSALPATRALLIGVG